MKLRPLSWVYALVGGALVVFWSVDVLTATSAAMPRRLTAPSVRTFAPSGSSGSSGGWFSGFSGGK